MNMNPFTSLLLALSIVSQIKAAELGIKGSTTHDLGAFSLRLDGASQVATELLAKAGPNAGNQDMSLLIPTENRTGDGFLALGDLQVRLRKATTDNRAPWMDASTHAKRVNLGIVGNNDTSVTALTTDVTPALTASLAQPAEPFPLKVLRTWSADQESLIFSFNLTNTGSDRIEIGALGVPTPWNNCFENATSAAEIWEQHFATDAAPSLHAGYTITNRFTGAGPTIVTMPVGDTSLEAYRLNYPNGTVDSWWPPTLLDFGENGNSFEGVFSWWAATKALDELDQKDADGNGFKRGQPWNTPTSLTLEPGTSQTIALRFVTASGPRQAEERLKTFDSPVIVGVPGFVVARGEPFRLVVQSSVQPSTIAAEPAVMDFQDARSNGQGIWVIDGSTKKEAFGRVRVTIGFGHPNDDHKHMATAHYHVIKPHAEQLDALGAFRFEKQYFEREHDYFNRSPSIISFDHSTMQQVTDDHRVWIAGLSDEAGSGSFVSAAAKLLARPDAAQVAKLEAFATQTLWGHLQNTDPSSSTYAAVRKSLFYWDPALPSGQGGYNPSIHHDDSWNVTEASKLDRAYNYPHAVVVYWILYRLARNYDKFVTQQSWQWYLTRCVDTIVALNKHAPNAGDALMEGTYFVRVLEDLKRENLTDAATQVEFIMRSRSDAWAAKQYPYASEFSWDNTAQEEVYAWSAYFNHSEAAEKTVETLMAVMSSVPHWAYSGAGRDMWDCYYSCKDGAGARLERLFHHYKGSQSSLALMDRFLTQPDDIKVLRAGYGGVLGPLASISEDGFGSTAFHSYNDYLDWDPLSGDNGVNMAVYALNARAVYVDHPEVGGHAGFGAAVSVAGSQVTILPSDGVRRRLFLAPIALLIDLDSGMIERVRYDTESHAVVLELAPGNDHISKARLRLTTTAKTNVSATYDTVEAYPIERGARLIPLQEKQSKMVELKRVGG